MLFNRMISLGLPLGVMVWVWANAASTVLHGQIYHGIRIKWYADMNLKMRIRRVNFCNWLLATPPRFLEDLCISDESAFSLNGFISTQRQKICSSWPKASDFAFEKRDARQKLTVWVGLIGNGGVVGPFFFQQNLNREMYLDMVNNEVVPCVDAEFPWFLRHWNGQLRCLWWAQDGTSSHPKDHCQREVARVIWKSSNCS